MNQQLEAFRKQSLFPEDAFRFACLLEVRSPKAGNVSPGKPLASLTEEAFETASEIAALRWFHSREASGEAPAISRWILESTQETVDQFKTNVNLGILLMAGPLIASDSQSPENRVPRDDWPSRVADVLSALSAVDRQMLYDAINVAAPGGMGESDEMDLRGPAPPNFLDAMRHAEAKDRIAQNYAGGFRDLFETVTPTIERCLDKHVNILDGICETHLELLASEPDSLIARKFGSELARSVQQRAEQAVLSPSHRDAFDSFLRQGARDRKNQWSNINPGTTADLIAAGLYILLREK